MPTRVDIPNVGLVEFPDSMSEEEVNEASKNLYWVNFEHEVDIPTSVEQGQQALEETEVLGSETLGKFGAGVARSVMEPYLGVKQLISGLDAEDKEELERVQQIEGGAATAGRITGELAQYALPGGAAARAARGGSALVRTLAPLAVDTAVAGGRGFSMPLTDPGDTRLRKATKEAAMALVGGTLGATASKLARGAIKKPVAEKILESGRARPFAKSSRYLTPGQASRSEAVGGIERAMEVTPFLARGTKNAQAKSLRESLDWVIEAASPPGKTAASRGWAAVDELDTLYKEGYRGAWKGASPVSPYVVRDMKSIARKFAPRLAKKEKRIVNNIMARIDDANNTQSKRVLESIDSEIRDELFKASKKGNRYLKSALGEMRDRLRQQLDDDGLQTLADLDGTYGNFKALQFAANAAKKTGGQPTYTQLMQGSARAGGVPRFAAGRSPLQDVAQEGLDIFETQVGGQPLEWFRRLAGAAPSPPGMKAMGNMVIGETGWQRSIQKQLAKEYAKLLREGGIRGGAIGAAVEE